MRNLSVPGKRLWLSGSCGSMKTQVARAERYCLCRSQLFVQDYDNRVMREVLAGIGSGSAADSLHRTLSP
jgi:hypothetical protein